MKDVTDTLYTERLILRPYKDEDANDCQEFLLDEQTGIDDGNYVLTLDDIPTILRYFKTGDDRYMVELKDDHKVIGVIHVMDTDDINVLSLGYIIAPLYRKQGYGYEAVQKVLDYTFYTDSIQSIIFEAYDYNIASIQLIKKLGAKYIQSYPVEHRYSNVQMVQYQVNQPNKC